MGVTIVITVAITVACLFIYKEVSEAKKKEQVKSKKNKSKWESEKELADTGEQKNTKVIKEENNNIQMNSSESKKEKEKKESKTIIQKPTSKSIIDLFDFNVIDNAVDDSFSLEEKTKNEDGSETFHYIKELDEPEYGIFDAVQYIIFAGKNKKNVSFRCDKPHKVKISDMKDFISDLFLIYGYDDRGRGRWTKQDSDNFKDEDLQYDFGREFTDIKINRKYSASLYHIGDEIGFTLWDVENKEDELEEKPMPREFINEDGTIKFEITGSFYRENDEQERLKDLDLNELVYLKPEPENTYDSDAIAVYSDDGYKMGYVPSSSLDDVHELLESSESYKCKVARISEHELPYVWVLLIPDE